MRPLPATPSNLSFRVIVFFASFFVCFVLCLAWVFFVRTTASSEAKHASSLTCCCSKKSVATDRPAGWCVCSILCFYGLPGSPTASLLAVSCFRGWLTGCPPCELRGLLAVPLLLPSGQCSSVQAKTAKHHPRSKRCVKNGFATRCRPATGRRRLWLGTPIL